jgi:hypothetical protein
MMILVLTGCHGEKAMEVETVRLPGYWFQLILIVAPLLILLVKGLMDLGAIKDSLVALGSQSRRIISRLEELEDRIKVLEKGGKSGSGPVKGKEE